MGFIGLHWGEEHCFFFLGFRRGSTSVVVIQLSSVLGSSKVVPFSGYVPHAPFGPSLGRLGSCTGVTFGARKAESFGLSLMTPTRPCFLHEGRMSILVDATSPALESLSCWGSRFLV